MRPALALAKAGWVDDRAGEELDGVRGAGVALGARLTVSVPFESDMSGTKIAEVSTGKFWSPSGVPAIKPVVGDE